MSLQSELAAMAGDTIGNDDREVYNYSVCNDCGAPLSLTEGRMQRAGRGFPDSEVLACDDCAAKHSATAGRDNWKG